MTVLLYGFIVFGLLASVIHIGPAIALTSVGTACAVLWVLTKEQKRRNHWIGNHFHDCTSFTLKNQHSVSAYAFVS